MNNADKYRLSLENVVTAEHFIEDAFKNTLQFYCEPLSKLLDVRVLIKDETLNPVGSFKGRGAEVFVYKAEKGEHFYCAIAGNFGMAMAFSCKKKQIKLTVYASVNGNPYKISRMKELGAEVVLYGNDFDAAKSEAKRKAAESNARFIEDSLDIESLEGAATIGLELLKHPDSIDVILIALGNGALFNGIARVIKHYKPATKIIAVQAKGASAMVDSWRKKELISYSSVNTIADGIAVRVPIPQALADMEGLADDAVLVNDNNIIRAMQLLYSEAGIVAEPSGAVGIAAILENPSLFTGKTVATIICGGNLTRSDSLIL